ncbi:hypothetical protein L0664_16980 [Octadecabacter sp. G9-8]|uniref:Uncharacterized protein n=1 Tax=Octadecabacter dasysiphoniae TaxID=2909341 RepID=A0ABS9CZX6_9RHOB|nr:hypothetical protein [Octadecabacter dasysiphoniae]MCF2872764.1 hypothetical protein [Octadecabacter dasysiphoniae]
MTTASTNTNETAKSNLSAKIDDWNARYDVWCDTLEAKILAVVWTGVLVLVTAVVIFGYPALIIAALTAVPVIFFFLWKITVGQ